MTKSPDDDKEGFAKESAGSLPSDAPRDDSDEIREGRRAESRKAHNAEEASDPGGESPDVNQENADSANRDTSAKNKLRSSLNALESDGDLTSLSDDAADALGDPSK